MTKRSSFVMPLARGDVVVIVAIGMLPDFMLIRIGSRAPFSTVY